MPSFSRVSSPTNRRREKTCSTISRRYGETLIFYESPHRIAETLAEILDVLGDREIVLTRELTKVYEEILRGNVSEVQRQIEGRQLKGEITLLISGKTRKNSNQ